MSKGNRRYTTFLMGLLSEASKTARQSFGKIQGVVKGSDRNQVLTSVDLAIGKFLVAKIREAFPAHNVLDEETGAIDNGSEFTWVVDPIDGTSNFAAGLPMYGIMIGLLENDAPIVGGAALPYFSDICVAEKGFGARNNDQLLTVLPRCEIGSSLIAYGIDGHSDAPETTREEATLFAEIVLRSRNIRTSNSVFDAMMVALGSYGAFLNRTSKVWDNVAQQVIIEEVGGIYTDFWGKAMDYSGCLQRINDNYTFCAAAPGIHESLQQIIHRIP